MMSEGQVAVTVRILDKEYKIACEEDEREYLIDAARYLDRKMQEVKDVHKIIGADRIAVMAALNIANEFLQTQSGLNPNSGSAAVTRLKGMTDKMQLALSRYKV